MKTRRSKKRLKQICLKTFATGVILNLMEFMIAKTFEFMLLYVKKLTAKVVFIVKHNILFKLWYGWEPVFKMS